MSQTTKIFDDLFAQTTGEIHVETIFSRIAEAEAAIEEHYRQRFIRAVGEDEDIAADATKIMAPARNKLRAELRNRWVEEQERNRKDTATNG